MIWNTNGNVNIVIYDNVDSLKFLTMKCVKRQIIGTLITSCPKLMNKPEIYLRIKKFYLREYERKFVRYRSIYTKNGRRWSFLFQSLFFLL